MNNKHKDKALQIIIKIFQTYSQFDWENWVQRFMFQESLRNPKIYKTIKNLGRLFQNEHFYTKNKEEIIHHFKKVKQLQKNNQNENVLQRINNFLIQGLSQVQNSEGILLVLIELSQTLDSKKLFLQKLISKNPHQIVYAYYYAEILHKMVQFDKSLQVINNSLAILKTTINKNEQLISQFYYLKGMVLKSKIKLRKSTKLFNFAIAKSHLNRKAWRQLVQVLMGLEDYEVVKNTIKRYKQLFPTSSLFFAVEIIINLIQGKTKVIQLCQQFDLIPDEQSCLSFLNMGIKKFYQLKFQQSYQYITKELKRDRNNIIAIRWAARCSFRMQQYQRSLYYHQLLRTLLKRKSQIDLDIAADYLALGQVQKARDIVYLIQAKIAIRQYLYPSSIILKLLQLSIKLKIGQFQNHYEALHFNQTNKWSIITIHILIVQLNNLQLDRQAQKSKKLVKRIDNLLHRVQIGFYLYEHFYLLYFMIDYKFRHQLFQNCQFLVKTIRKIIERVRTFNKSGAQTLQSILREKKAFIVELMFIQ